MRSSSDMRQVSLSRAGTNDRIHKIITDHWNPSIRERQRDHFSDHVLGNGRLWDSPQPAGVRQHRIGTLVATGKESVSVCERIRIPCTEMSVAVGIIYFIIAQCRMTFGHQFDVYFPYTPSLFIQTDEDLLHGIRQAFVHRKASRSQSHAVPSLRSCLMIVPP